MVRPRDFGFNEETAVDNEFQSKPDVSAAEINQRANAEFQDMVDRLRREGVQTLVLEPDDGAAPGETPDAVFPNNWFSTHADGSLITYPMMAPCRRAEVRPEDLTRLLRGHGYLVKEVVRFDQGHSERFLEGTGSLVIDRAGRVVYAARSQRCDADLFAQFVAMRAYDKGILFDAATPSGRPIYHTNVMMNLGERYAVVCAEAIVGEADRERVMRSLRRSFDTVEISIEQMRRHYCGNILQVRGRDDELLIVMSSRANRGFTPEQRERLSRHGRIVDVDLDTIETVGGGSARCMMAEIFSPRSGCVRSQKHA